MFISKKKHEADLALMAKANVDLDETLMVREATIGRLQRENAALLSELTRFREARAKGNKNLIPGGKKKQAAA
ncbi:hypothetical protein [Sphingobium sp. YC-XJ3]|uniref:hypothetical protein n=1 Tax=Sphingobium sp. YC-XJ3 TaxID=3024245 RepID=UPI002360F917|nr:hypothetical protein [Sphingobium sp. YC-XJ3]WDA36440.1 hypothetical protein PO876_23925 [Sphingobium sp. YC-XJ3]